MGKSYSIKAEGAKVASLDVFGDIEDGDGQQFIQDLRALGDVQKINVTIDSLGGSFFDGLTIHNALKGHGADVTVGIAGIAASAATLVCCAGSKVFMPESSFLFIHNPTAAVIGEEKDLIEVAGALRKVGESMQRIYSQRSGKGEATARGWMNDGTWFTAREAKDAGLCDLISDSSSFAPDARQLQRFAACKNLPPALRAILDRSAGVYPRRQIAARILPVSRTPFRRPRAVR